ncbi:MAG TPA: bifunctional methylenetetrahydrofolate dehydrogenase/methenyltetrahydrofolate cyclohydrolase FolD [Deltaproteobacteria bacterium]|nr:bifunctional methylenetetrahydrofolate dehydrogenase/methenyltetrahydrofolate cyclohydrolase FolD [Deltaproteobacteria bacterium]HQI81335.1 bifunctional methylenetetrahydrofolate dehydrogenase/methenyltetrahydrofolate cyclohydrolase FolD [Deltaproteobacteria bacterium]
MAIIIDGNELSRRQREITAKEALEFTEKAGRPPGLAVVLVGEDPASAIYVKNKKKACETAGIRSFEYRLDSGTSREELLGLVHRLNADDLVDGILVQLPLPAHLDSQEVLLAIDPGKDVDGFHPYNMGRLLTGEPTLVPCTPAGIMCMLREHGVSLRGKDAVVVGRSNIVGKPMAILLMMEHATVTICHSRTVGLEAKVAAADVVVAAIGRAEMIRGDWIKPGAVVIDVGMNRTASGLKGDVQFEEAARRASLITPVPGGVGPMTITMLLDNTLRAARIHAG